MMLLRLLYYKQQKSNATSLVIEVVTGLKTFKIPYRHLSYPPSFYKIVISKMTSSAVYHSTWLGFGKLILDVQNVSVVDIIYYPTNDF